MTLLWPEMLWLLLAVPVLIAAYSFLLHRKKKRALKYASLTMVRGMLADAHPLRRHVPPLLFLLAIILMLLAIARPAAVVTLPTQHRTIILAMDISGSMRAMDVEPNRLAAAQAAARSFIADQPGGTRIGVVSFAATAMLVQPATENREDVLAAIERFQLQRGTAIGSGILVALKAIFPEIEIDPTAPPQSPGRTGQRGVPIDQATADDRSRALSRPVPPGSYTSAAIVLLTDGQATTGPDPVEAARMAAQRGVRIYTVGVGTVGGQVLGFEGWSMRVKLDEDTLKSISNMTRGEYFFAGSAKDLKKIYKALNTRFALEKKEMEVTALFAAASAALALMAAVLSVLWFNRIL